MTSIRISNLRIRLPSEAQNIFNPSYAFGVQRLTPNSGGVLALKDAGSHEILLPMDSEGNVLVRPGRDYELVRVMERHSAAKTPAAAANSASTTTAATTSSPAAQKGASAGEARAEEGKGKSKRAGQPKGESSSSAAAVKRPRETDEEKMALATTPTTTTTDSTRKERKKHKSQSPHISPEAVAVVEDTRSLAQLAQDDAAAAPSGPRKGSPKATPKTSPALPVEKEDASAAPLSMLFGDASTADEHDGEPESSSQPTAKKRGRKPKQPAQAAPAQATPPRARSASPPEAAPVTMPPSARGSVVRRPRPPFQDSSSDSD